MGYLFVRVNSERARFFLDPKVLLLHHEIFKGGRQEAAEAEEHAEITPNVGDQCISIVDKVLLLHLIISCKWTRLGDHGKMSAKIY